MRKLLLLSAIACFFHIKVFGQNPTHKINFETSEVTQPSVNSMPDGRSFIFNLLGHLFSMPATGGEPTQLTFGPYYDHEPVVSPDGKRIAFISNRDGSDGNIFILNLTNKKISQVSNVFMVAGKPAWSPDGKRIAFLSYWKREEYPLEKVPFFGNGDMTTLYTVDANGKNQQLISQARPYSSVFYLQDGSLAWSYTESKGQSQSMGPFSAPQQVTTIFESMPASGGNIQRMGTMNGRTGNITMLADRKGFLFIANRNVKRFMLGDTAAQTVAPFKGMNTDLSISADGKILFAAADSRLWAMDMTSFETKKLNWKAKVKMDVTEPVVRKWDPFSGSKILSPEILSPDISADGKKIVFMAAGAIWLQELKNGKPAKIISESAFQMEPSFSPDGKRIAFVSDNKGKRELHVYDLITGKVNTVATAGGDSWEHQPEWSSDGSSIIYQQSDLLGYPYKFIKANPSSTNDTSVIIQTSNSWNGRPHFSPDGKSIYYTARTQMIANIYKLSLQPGATPQAVTDLKRHAHDGLVSPDEKWIAFRRNNEIWVAKNKDGVLKDEDFKLFSDKGGRSFHFTRDGSSIVYSEGTKVWKRPLKGGSAIEIPIHLSIPKAEKKPLLISNVHVLDFNTGKFTDATSVFLENGKIGWIGSAEGKQIPANTTRMDAGGRYAIPGLMDSHIHSAWSNQQITEDRFIAYGVTSIRDVGSRLDVINSLKDRGETTNLPIPRYFAAGEIFEGLVPLWGDAFLEITTKEEARNYVHRAKENGALFIKVYASLPWYLKTEVAAEAKKTGMPIVGHGIALDEITRSVNFGIKSIEHSGPNNDDIVKMMSHAGTWLDPTPTIFSAGNTLKLADSATLDKKFRTFIPEPEIESAGFGRKPSEGQIAAWKNTLSSLKRIHDSGVKMLDGTDALMTGVFHGPSVHWVLQFFSEAGIPNIDVLKIATLDAADVVGASGHIGSIEKGKLADIVLLDANPLEDISNTMKIWRVIKAGTVFDPATMRE
ncbi:MAG: amidohydrolase family protein [Chitinophagales bacterium]|nr:amidohydrolase family protein [Chitinophagales bacterium]